MILQELFHDYGYDNIEINIKKMQHGFILDYFYKDDEKPTELLGIYLSKNKDELIFVLDSRGREINILCQNWDKMIRDFIIFGSEDRKALEKIKYNIVQFVLLDHDIVDKTEERSLNISRKIFLRCEIKKDGNVVLARDEELKLPFYQVSSEKFNIKQDLVDRLNECVFKKDLSLNFLNGYRKKANKNSKSFSDYEYNLIESWLCDDENNKS